MNNNTIFKNQKSITVSIVTYNSADEIDVLMGSLFNCSSFEEMTVYVIDNASKDNTVNLIKNKYPWVRVIENKTNVGFGRAHNKVIKNIKSKYHIIINPDINLPKNTISIAINYMDKNKDIAILTPYVVNEDGTQQFLPKRNPTLKYMIGGMLEKKFKWAKKLREEYTLENYLIDSPVNVEFCTGAFMFTRTDMLKQIGGFDERYFLHFEDADLTREINRVGRTVYHPEVKVIHKWHRENKQINKSFFIALKSMYMYMDKWKNETYK